MALGANRPSGRSERFSQARTREILCKPMEEQNPRLTRGLSPVYPRFITGTASVLRCWLLTSVPKSICLCKPFSCKACPGKNKLSSIDKKQETTSNTFMHHKTIRLRIFCSTAYNQQLIRFTKKLCSLLFLEKTSGDLSLMPLTGKLRCACFLGKTFSLNLEK